MAHSTVAAPSWTSPRSARPVSAKPRRSAAQPLKPARTSERRKRRRKQRPKSSRVVGMSSRRHSRMQAVQALFAADMGGVPPAAEEDDDQRFTDALISGVKSKQI